MQQNKQTSIFPSPSLAWLPSRQSMLSQLESKRDHQRLLTNGRSPHDRQTQASTRVPQKSTARKIADHKGNCKLHEILIDEEIKELKMKLDGMKRFVRTAKKNKGGGVQARASKVQRRKGAKR
jgi:hypothetical protein